MGGDGRSGLSPENIEGDALTPEKDDELQSARDTRFKKFSYRWRAETKRIAKRKMREARRRKDALHRWTTMIVRDASALSVFAPPVRDNTKSAKGDALRHGAAVETVAVLNRNTLGQAPAMAVQMLEYKAAEAAIPFDAHEARETPLAIGRDLPEVKKQERRTRRKLKELA